MRKWEKEEVVEEKSGSKKKEGEERVGLTFNAGVKDSYSNPISVIVERGEIVDIQHHECVTVVVVVVAITLRGQARGALRRHFHRCCTNRGATFQIKTLILLRLRPSTQEIDESTNEWVPGIHLFSSLPLPATRNSSETTSAQKNKENGGKIKS